MAGLPPSFDYTQNGDPIRQAQGTEGFDWAQPNVWNRSAEPNHRRNDKQGDFRMKLMKSWKRRPWGGILHDLTAFLERLIVLHNFDKIKKNE